MDKHYVKTVLEGLKSSSSKRVRDSLGKIKSKIITNEDGIKMFADCGGLNYLVPHLRKPNERVLDLTLSILGNCCLQDECRIDVGKLHIASSLISVLKMVSRDSIIGRACRLIGNLAQNQSNAADLHNHSIVPALITVIESRNINTSYPTLTMAVRALRQLWTVTDKREEMLAVNSVRCIAILLITECESAGIFKSDIGNKAKLRQSQEQLISGILKCIGYFSANVTPQCAEQIQGDGRGYQSLVALIDKFESLALRCLMNLCFLSSFRPLVGAAGFVPCLVSILQRNSDASLWPEGAARTLSQLSGESVNRARIRQSVGLPLLLAAAKEHTHALRALLQYVFDDTSFQVLVKSGLITLLVDELKKHIITMGYEHECKRTEVHNAECNEELHEEEPGMEKRNSVDQDDKMRVVIERDDMFIGFGEIIDSDASDDEETPQNRQSQLKRSRSISPVNIMKRFRGWSNSLYFEAKPERDGPSTSRSPISPERAPMSPASDRASGFSPDLRSGRTRYDWSPESGFSTGEGSVASPHGTEYQWSPASSAGPTSPFSVENEDSTDSEISGRYSPVCDEEESSDKEAEADDVTGSLAVDAAQAAMDELVVTDLDAPHDDDEPFENEKETYFDLNSSRIACVLVLLYRATSGSHEIHHGAIKESTIPKDMLEQLTGKDCQHALLDYAEKCRKPMGRVGRILNLIFSNALSLKNILKHKIVQRLHKISSADECSKNLCKQCKLIKKLSVKLMTKLSKMAESRYGIGEISFQLLRGPDEIKETLSLTLPYIVKSKAILKIFYIECSALIVLLTGVAETTDNFQYYVSALGKLSAVIRIKDPKALEKKYLRHVLYTYDTDVHNLPNQEQVTFELDDASTMLANRLFLCEKSDVFNAMLTGCFKESYAKTVRIKNATKPGLEYLITLLQLGLNDDYPMCVPQVFPLAEKLETNLETILLADRFLFHKLKVWLSSAILQFMMTPDTAEIIYSWSLSEGMGHFCVESVAYLLTGVMYETERAQAFRNILNLEYKEQWLDDIKSMITRQLQECI